MVVHKKCPWQSPTWIAWFWNYIDSKRDGIDVKFGTDERDSERTTFEEWEDNFWRANYREVALFMRNSVFKRWCRKFTKKLHSARFKEWVKWSTPCPCESHRTSQLYCTSLHTHPACSKWRQSVNSGRWLAKDVITLLLQKWWGH